jgi:uncharacterized protein (TIGR02268 family)
MLQPVTLAGGLLCLLAVTAAEAQPRTLRSRRVTVAATPNEPLPEVRVAAREKTLLLLDAPIDKNSVQAETARVQVLDVGERSVLFETLAAPGDKERWVLRVRYAGRGRPEWAAFALVAHPTEVDVQVEAVRPQQPLAECQEQLADAQARCEAPREEVWVLADRLGGQSVQAKLLNPPGSTGWAYRLGEGLLLVLTLGPKRGPPWVPTAAKLSASEGPLGEVKVRAVHVRPGAPGQWGTVAVEAELPSPAAGEKLDLELLGPGGQSLTLPRLEIPTPEKKEAKP